MVFVMFLLSGCVQQKSQQEETVNISTDIKKEEVILVKENITEENEEVKTKENKEEHKIEEKTIPKEEIKEPEEKEVIKPIEKQSCKLIMFHNNKGLMCLGQLDFLESIESKYPSLIIEEHLTYEQGTIKLMLEETSEYSKSEGVSTSFRYLPITFINGHAYSGFDGSVKKKIEDDVKEVCK